MPPWSPRIFLTPARLALLAALWSCLFWTAAARAADGEAPAFAEDRAASVWREAVGELKLQADMGPPAPRPRPAGDKPDLPAVPGEALVALGGLFLLGLVVILVKYYRTWAARPAEKKEKTGGDETPEVDTAPLLQAGRLADELAGKEKIAEAMHALLLDTIRELKVQKKQTFPDSHTCREIASGLSIGAAAGQALGEMVALVEPAWFGSGRPELADYKLLRRKYDGFLLLLGGRRA